jgi:hypothetical protein
LTATIAPAHWRHGLLVPKRAMVFELMNCPSCGRGVVSTIGPSGRRHIIDVEPIEDGTMIIVGPSGASKEAIARPQIQPAPLHRCGGFQDVSRATGQT